MQKIIIRKKPRGFAKQNLVVFEFTLFPTNLCISTTLFRRKKCIDSTEIP